MDKGTVRPDGIEFAPRPSERELVIDEVKLHSIAKLVESRDALNDRQVVGAISAQVQFATAAAKRRAS